MGWTGKYLALGQSYGLSAAYVLTSSQIFLVRPSNSVNKYIVFQTIQSDCFVQRTSAIYTEVSCSSLIQTKLVQRANTSNRKDSIGLLRTMDCR